MQALNANSKERQKEKGPKTPGNVTFNLKLEKIGLKLEKKARTPGRKTKVKNIGWRRMSYGGETSLSHFIQIMKV